MIDYHSLPEVIVYHRCAIFAAGSISASSHPAYWWAQRDGAGWSIRITGIYELDRPALEARILRAARLDPDAANDARAAQDARAEAPDL